MHRFFGRAVMAGGALLIAATAQAQSVGKSYKFGGDLGASMPLGDFGDAANAGSRAETFDQRFAHCTTSLSSTGTTPAFQVTPATVLAGIVRVFTPSECEEIRRTAMKVRGVEEVPKRVRAAVAVPFIGQRHAIRTGESTWT